MKTGTHSNNKNNSSSFVPTMQTQLQSRPWAEPTEAIASSSEAPELQKEPEDRERFGHDLANIPIFAPAPPPESGDQPPIQAKGMTIGAPGDKYEQEADRVARKVVSEINQPIAQRVSEETELHSPGVISQDYSFLGRRKQSDGMVTTFWAEVQRKEAIASGEASKNLESAINTAKGGGQPLDAGLQQSMGQAMNADFSGVRVHTDARSDRLNQSLQAKAFTTGQDVFFRQGAYQPGSRGGQELIAHELTHVVQQNGGAVMRFVQQHENLQPSILAKSIPNPKNVVQRTYLDNGQKVTDDAFQTIIKGVEVISFANRHTILGLLQNKGGAKQMNTVLLKPIEMQLVANDAYDCAWSDDKGRLSVTDGTTFTSCGITWGIDARPNSDPPSIHVYPTEGGGKTIDIGDLIAPLKAFLGQLKKGESIEEATEYAVDLAKKLKRDADKLRIVIIALQNMGEI